MYKIIFSVFSFVSLLLSPTYAADHNTSFKSLAASSSTASEVANKEQRTTFSLPQILTTSATPSDEHLSALALGGEFDFLARRPPSPNALNAEKLVASLLAPLNDSLAEVSPSSIASLQPAGLGLALPETSNLFPPTFQPLDELPHQTATTHISAPCTTTDEIFAHELIASENPHTSTFICAFCTTCHHPHYVCPPRYAQLLEFDAHMRREFDFHCRMMVEIFEAHKRLMDTYQPLHDTDSDLEHAKGPAPGPLA